MRLASALINNVTEYFQHENQWRFVHAAIHSHGRTISSEFLHFTSVRGGDLYQPRPKEKVALQNPKVSYQITGPSGQIFWVLTGLLS